MRFHWTGVILQWGIHNRTPLTQLRNSWEPWVAALDTRTINGDQFLIWKLPLILALKSSGLWNASSSLPPAQAHIVNKLLLTVQFVLLCVVQTSCFSGTKANLDLVHVWRDNLGRGSRGPLVFCLRRCRSRMGSVLGHRGGFRGSLWKTS